MSDRPADSSQFQRTLKWALLAPVALALVLAGVFLWQVLVLLGQARWVDHTDQVIGQINETERLGLRMQAGVRAYLLSDQSFFLDEYRAADATAAAAADRLVSLVADNPTQTQRARQAADVVARSRTTSAQLLAMHRDGSEYRTLIADPAYREFLIERDQIFARLRAEEHRLRETRVARVDRTTVTIITVSLALAVTGGAAVAGILRRYVLSVVSSYGAALRRAEQNRDELEHRVAERTAELREAVGHLEDFAHTVSHDLRAPLRAIQGFSQALLEDQAADLDPTGRTYAQRMVAAAERMDLMIQDLLSYSRLTRNQIVTETVDLDAAAGQALVQVRDDVQRRGARVKVGAPLGRVRGHRPTLVQVLANLLANAVKFVPPDVTPDVVVSSSDDGDGRVTVSVTDNGIGIAPEHHERIFDMFERLHGHETYPGTGIGLAIVRKAVERMGGRAGVRSEPGRGSTFWIELPKG